MFNKYSRAYQVSRDENHKRNNNSIYYNNSNINLKQKIPNKNNIKRNSNQNFYANSNKNFDYNYPGAPNNYQMCPPMFINPMSNTFSYPLFSPSPFETLPSLNNYNQSQQINTGFFPMINNNNSSYNSLDGVQESGSGSYLSTSEGGEQNYALYYENFGDNYCDSLKKGLTDITNLYNSQKNNRPKCSLLCNYYCNLERTSEDDAYLALQIQRLSEKLAKITKTNKTGESNKINEVNTNKTISENENNDSNENESFKETFSA